MGGTDRWTKVCVGQPAELSSEGPGQTCTAYSQCGGQNWHGCTECPGQQVCQLKGTDRWTKVCVGQLAELSSAAEVVNTTTAGFTTGGLAETQDLPCGSDNSDDCVTEFHHGGAFLLPVLPRGGQQPSAQQMPPVLHRVLNRAGDAAGCGVIDGVSSAKNSIRSYL